jgi:hypothetical protein
MAVKFYFTSNIFLAFQNLPVAWALITRGLMPIFPPKKAKGAREVAAIVDKVHAMQKTGGTR